ncbi:neprosin family prolyl endopeptidase [Acetobacterium wieringae]|uniref:neprosin family prolyl endopeptidase n=1 Tax=Acetobacterium wieringae TaxID=52694 RepID=UPI00350E525A
MTTLQTNDEAERNRGLFIQNSSTSHQHHKNVSECIGTKCSGFIQSSLKIIPGQNFDQFPPVSSEHQDQLQVT